MNDDNLKKMKQALDIARKILDTAEIVVKIINDDNFNSHEKANIIDVITSRTRHEITMIQNEEYFESFGFVKGGLVKGDTNSKVAPVGNNEHVINIKKENVFDIDKIRAEIDRLTNDK